MENMVKLRVPLWTVALLRVALLVRTDSFAASALVGPHFLGYHFLPGLIALPRQHLLARTS